MTAKEFLTFESALHIVIYFLFSKLNVQSLEPFSETTVLTESGVGCTAVEETAHRQETEPSGSQSAMRSGCNDALQSRCSLKSETPALGQVNRTVTICKSSEPHS